MHSFFKDIREYPEQNASGVMVRLIDGLGYRFFWATEALNEDDYIFTPGNDCKAIGPLIEHIWRLADWCLRNVLPEEPKRSQPPAPDDQRAHALEMLFSLRTAISEISSDDFFLLRIQDKPIWHMINGPLSDAISHTGQIAMLRRLNNNVVPRHYHFLCHEKSD